MTEMKARDDWYVDHMQIFEDLNKAIKERYEMIERAVESERKSQHMSRAFTERVEEMVQARSEEMAQEEAASAEAEEATAAVEVVEETPAEEAPVEEEPAGLNPKQKLQPRKRRPLRGRQSRPLGLGVGG